MQLFRALLLEAEKGPFRLPADADRFEPHDPVTVMRHAEWLKSGGLVEGGFLRSGQDDHPVDAFIDRPTWEGVQWLDSARNETVWKRALHAAASHGGGVSLAVMKAILEQKAKELFGLDK